MSPDTYTHGSLQTQRFDRAQVGYSGGLNARNDSASFSIIHSETRSGCRIAALEVITRLLYEALPRAASPTLRSQRISTFISDSMPIDLGVSRTSLAEEALHVEKTTQQAHSNASLDLYRIVSVETVYFETDIKIVWSGRIIAFCICGDLA